MRRFAARLIALIGFAALAAGCNQTAMGPIADRAEPFINYTPTELRELTVSEKTALAASISKGLKDPDSAKFQWLYFPKNPPAGESLHYCGMVNAKNSYGGYTGAKPFMALVLLKNGKPTSGVLEVAGSDEFSITWIREQCQKKGFDPLLAG